MDEMGVKIVDTLTKLEGAVTEAAPHVWQAALQRAYIGCVGWFAMLLVFLILARVMLVNIKLANSEDWHDGHAAMAFMSGGLAMVILFSLSVTFSSLAVHWSAIKHVSSLLTGE